MKKRVLSFALALALCLGLAAPALAADDTFTETVPCKYSEVRNFCEGFAAVEYNGKWGFVDKSGNEVVPCKYDNVEDFCEGFAAVRIKTEEEYKWGFVDTTGKQVVPCKYYFVCNFSEGLAAVKASYNYKWGFVDTTGKEVIPCQYRYVFDFSEGLAAIEKDDYPFGFIDKTGAEVIPFEYQFSDYSYFSEGLAAVRPMYLDRGGYRGYGFINEANEEVVPFKYSGVRAFSEGFAAVKSKDEDKWGFVDATGTEAVTCEYDKVEDFSEGLAAVFADDKWGFVDTTGKRIAPCKYDEVSSFSGGLAKVAVFDEEVWELMYGFIDKNGNEVIPCKYNAAEDFSEGLAAVYSGNKGGFVDSTGKMVVPCKYEIVSSFSGGLAMVAVRDEKVWELMYGFIDKNGSEVVPCKYGAARSFSEGMAEVQRRKGYWGFISADDVASMQTSNGMLPDESGTAYESTQTVTVDGKAVQFRMYALKDASGGKTNYIKLRDLADALDGTAAQFNVTWSKAAGIGIETGKTYVRNGSENKALYSGDMPYKKSAAMTAVDGAAADMAAFAITDAGGGQSTYYQLRDLGLRLGFNVGWSSDKGVFIETGKPYTDAD